MAEKQPNNKEHRHESAKNKYQHYQRVLSCKNLIKNIAPLNPAPGQFVFESSRPPELPALAQSKSTSIILTKNIKSIVQQKNPAPLGEIISQVVTAKARRNSAAHRPGLRRENSKQYIPKDFSQPYFKRPISAQIYQEIGERDINQSLLLKNAIEHDRRTSKKSDAVYKNYFQVKPKLKIPKHIYGYNAVSLESQSLSGTKVEQPEAQVFRGEAEQIPRDERSFLPTEYYMKQQLKPDELMDKYRNSEGYVFGFSKWFENDGSYSWKRCRVIGFSKDEERWEIQWLGVGTTKKVSRNNLYFERQQYDQFHRAVAAAEEMKKKSEVFMKYNFMIDIMKSPTPEISHDAESRISALSSIESRNRDIVEDLAVCKNKLLSEVKDLYVRACHQFELNSIIPFNENYKNYFAGTLPDEIFDPNPRKLMLSQQATHSCTIGPHASSIFSQGLKKIKEKSFLNSEKKIRIMESVNMMVEQLSIADLLKDYKRFEARTYSVKQLEDIIARNISDFFYKINCRICEIEHHIGRELDQIYASKKIMQEDSYDSAMDKYYRFLLLVNMKLENNIRESVGSLIEKLVGSLPQFAIYQAKVCHQANFDWNIVFMEKKTSLQISVSTQIKQGRLQVVPAQFQLTKTFNKSLQTIIKELKSLKCVSKSYLPEIRPGNLLKILNPDFQTEQLDKINDNTKFLTQVLDKIETNFRNFITHLNLLIVELFTQNNELQKRNQKKSSYNEIEELVDKVNSRETELQQLIKVNSFNMCGIYTVDFQQIKAKYQLKARETMKQAAAMLIEKIYKDNQKIEKVVDSFLEGMQNIPKTIAQYVELQKFVVEAAKQEIEKIHQKARNLTEKVNILEKMSQTIEYREYQNCFQIYLKPIKLKRAREDAMYKLENYYKKNFAEELTKDSVSVLENIKNCQKMFSETLTFRTLADMDRSFHVFSKLNDELETSCQKMVVINQKETLLKWNKTNFDRLLELKQQFEPFYKIITLHKNYKMNLIPLMDQAFVQISYAQVSSNVCSSTDALRSLRQHRFSGDQIYQPIIQQILDEYQDFSDNLLLIKTLRNPDLRDRHWVIIQKITGTSHIRSEHITLKQIIGDPIKRHEAELIRVSQIATKELIYEKSLNQLRREWKDVRVVLRDLKVGNQSFKFFKNIPEIERKLENDIIEINNILSSSFIKFLEVDVLAWKSSVLDKVYEFIKFWEKFENKVIFYLRLVGFPKMAELFPGWPALQKNFEKQWRQFMVSIEFQSLIVDIINLKTWENISILQSQIEEVQKIVSTFLQQKKKINAKLRLFSDDTLVSMMIDSNSEATLENLKKCFAGTQRIRRVSENTGKQLLEIENTLSELINIEIETAQEPVASEPAKLWEANPYHQFDQLLFSIDKQLKQQIKTTFMSSLKGSSDQLLAQVQLLRARLLFRDRVEGEVQAARGLDGLEITIHLELKDYVTAIRVAKDAKETKTLSLLVLEKLYEEEALRNIKANLDLANNFNWYKLPKYQLAESIQSSSPKLRLNIGSFSREYQFQLVECKSFCASTYSDLAFLHICTALQDRMLVGLRGSPGSGRVVSLSYLGELMGRNVSSVSCSELTTAANMLEYLKIGASGLFLIVEHMHKLRTENLAAFGQGLQIFWMNYQLTRNNHNTFKVGEEDFVLDSGSFAFFTLWDNTQSMHRVSSMKQLYRQFTVYPIEPRVLLRTALMSCGSTHAAQIDLGFVVAVLNQMTYLRRMNKLMGMNTNKFIWQVAEAYQLLSRSKFTNEQSEDDKNRGHRIAKQTQILQQSVEAVVKKYMPLDSNPSDEQNQVLQSFYKIKVLLKRKPSAAFTKINQKQESDELNDKKTEQEALMKIIDAEQFAVDYKKTSRYRKNIQNLIAVLSFHCGAVITGVRMSGKSSLVASLEDEGSRRYNITTINPLAYSRRELYYGSETSAGILQQLSEQMKIKQSVLELSGVVTNLLSFDSGIGVWAQPLLSVVDKPSLPAFACADGSLILLPSNLKLVFEAEHLAEMAPNSFHSLGILVLDQQIHWRHSFANNVQRYFKGEFLGSFNYQLMKQLFDQTFESTYEFYESILTEKDFSQEKTHFPIISRSCIIDMALKLINLMYFKQDVVTIRSEEERDSLSRELEEKIKADISNIYTFSVVLTLGYLIPEESRKIFSRHFKYVLEQTEMCRAAWRRSPVLSKEDENIYEYAYEHGQWSKWKASVQVANNSSDIFAQRDQILMNVVLYHIENNVSCFIVGKECSSKNYLVKNLIKSLENQRYTKNYFTISAFGKKFQICDTISEMILTQKYSSKLNGFSNCKNNLMYIEDLNLPAPLDANNSESTVAEFLRQFYRQRSVFVDCNRYNFTNMQFYGTLRPFKSMPTKLLRYLNPITMSSPESRVHSILQHVISSSSVSPPEKELLVRCTLNFHEVVCRDLAQRETDEQFNIRDMVKVVKGLCRITQNSAKAQLSIHDLLRFWVYMVDRVYSQKIVGSKKGVVFYLINNVLMEQQRVRYRVVCPSSDFFVLDLSQNLGQPRKSYQSYTLASLKQTLYMRATENGCKSAEQLLFLEENYQDMLKIAIKFVNSFDFLSKVVIFINEQHRECKSILKIIGYLQKSLTFSLGPTKLNHGIDEQQKKLSTKAINSNFTRLFFESVAEPPNTQIFDTPTSAQGKAESFSNSHRGQASAGETKGQAGPCKKTKIILHLRSEDDQQSLKNQPNFLMQDLLGYLRFNKYPVWALPNEHLLEHDSLEGPKQPKTNSKYKESSELAREQQQRAQLIATIDLAFVVEYTRRPDYLFTNYPSLAEEASVIHLANPEPVPVEVQKSAKIIVTDLNEDDHEPGSDEIVGLQGFSSEALAKAATKHGRKVYLDLVFELIQDYLHKMIPAYDIRRPLAYRLSFRSIFNYFIDNSDSLKQRKAKIAQKFSLAQEAVSSIELDLQTRRKQHNFTLEQFLVKYEEMQKTHEIEAQKYDLQKKRIQELEQKNQRKTKQYEENLQFYRKSTDKLAFEYGQARQKLVKSFSNYENMKFNISNAINSQIKLLYEALAYIIGLVEIKKNEDMGPTALREILKTIREKKMSKIISKCQFEKAVSKICTKVQGLLQQLQAVKNKNEFEGLKKAAEAQIEEARGLKNNMIQFLDVYIKCYRQFSLEKIRQSYETYQSAAKVLQKIKADLLKKQKSKAIKQLFQGYEKLTVQKEQVCKKIADLKEAIHNLDLTLHKIVRFKATYLPRIMQTSTKHFEADQQTQHNELVMSVCVRFFNEFHGLPSDQLQKIFADISKKLQDVYIVKQVWLKELKLEPRAVVNSIYAFKDVVLVRIKESRHNSQQGRTMLDTTLYSNKRCLKIDSREFMKNYSTLVVASYDALVISLPALPRGQTVQLTRQILCFCKLASPLNKTIFLESPYFCQESICNYPYIDLVSNNGARLPYEYLESRCREVFYAPTRAALGLAQQQSQKQHKILEKDNVDSQLLSCFLGHDAAKADLSSFEQLYGQIDSIYAGRRQTEQCSEHSTSEIRIPSQEQIREEDHKLQGLTQKQRQKLYMQQKICELHVKLYVICSAYHHHAGSSYNLSFEDYLELAVRSVKQLGGTSPATELLTVKDLRRLRKDLSNFLPQGQNYLIITLCNIKISSLGSAHHFTRYVDLLMQKLPQDLEATPEAAQSALLKQAAQTLLLNLPNLEALHYEVTQDQDLWWDDIDRSLKQQSELPIPWLYLLISANRGAFNKHVLAMQKKVVEKSESDPQTYELTPVEDSLKTALSRKDNLFQQASILSVVIDTTHMLHQVCAFIAENKYQFQFLDVTKYISRATARAHPNKRRQSKEVQNELEALSEASKILIYAINNGKDLSNLEQFIGMLDAAIEEKRLRVSSQNQEACNSKLLILWGLMATPAIPNVASIQQHPAGALRKTILLAYNMSSRFYSSYFAQKFKVKQYNQLALPIKQAIYGVLNTGLSAVLDYPVEQGYDVYYVAKRVAQMAERLSRVCKAAKTTQGSEDCGSMWSLAMEELMTEMCPFQSEAAQAIIQSSSAEAARVVDDQALTPAKVQALSCESTAQIRARKAYAMQYINLSMSLYPTPPLQVGDSLTVSQFYQKLHQQISQKQTDQISKLVLDNLQLQELQYLLVRKSSLEYFLPVHAVDCRLQLVPPRDTEEDTTMPALSGVTIRRPLYFTPGPEKPYLLQPSAFISSKKVSNESNARLVCRPELKFYELNVPESLSMGSQRLKATLDLDTRL